jgi:hypothetical protein
MTLLVGPLTRRLVNPKFKVAESVVVTDSVLVVDMFCGKQLTTELFLHDEPMLKNVEANLSTRRPDVDISTFVCVTPTLPAPSLHSLESVGVLLK